MTNQKNPRQKPGIAGFVAHAIFLLLLLISVDIASAGQIVMDYFFDRPEVMSVIIDGDAYHRVTMNDAPNGGHIGHPALPARGTHILLPYGTEITGVAIETGERVLVGRDFLIEPVAQPVPLSADPGEVVRTSPDPAVYGSSQPIPTVRFENVGTQSFRGYSFAVLKLSPVEYVPSTGELYYYPEMRIVINTETTQRSVSLFRGMTIDDMEIRTRVDNPDLIPTYPAAMRDATASFDLLIITTPDLVGPFQPLKDYHDTTGILTEIRTTTDIGSNDPTAVRDYIRTVYETDGIQYVLIGGSDVLIPAVDLYVQTWEDGQEEDDPYIEYDLPGDIYFACLDNTYNYDGDSYWGEPDDGYNGGDVDLVAEVYVGRAPVSSAVDAYMFVYKTLEYLTVDDPYLNKALWLGEHLGFGGTGEYGGYSKDDIIDLVTTWGYTTAGLPTDRFELDKLYDMIDTWPATDLVDRVNDGVHIINHFGHCNPDWALKMTAYIAAASFVSNKLCFIYSQGCLAGAFDKRDCWAEVNTVKTTTGAFAIIMNARFGFGVYGSNDGPSQRFDREFFDAIYGEGIVELARANQDSKEDNLYRIDDLCMRWCIYQLNLFGDPTIALKGTQSCDQSGLADSDADGACDVFDNCPEAANENQLDADGDMIGDVCDACPNDGENDGDEDGYCSDVDNCPTLANADQTDSDGDGFGDACDICAGFDDLADGDSDDVPDGCDFCPAVSDPTNLDTDVDGLGDVCDNCPDLYNPDQADINENEIGDACETCCRLRGDADTNGELNISDLTFMVEYLFGGGSTPECEEEGDFDDNGALDISDVTFAVDYFFGGGPAPPPCIAP